MSAQLGLPRLRGSIFIVTYGRSGSTVLQRILNAIPGACLRGESDRVLEMQFRSWRESGYRYRRPRGSVRLWIRDVIRSLRMRDENDRVLEALFRTWRLSNFTRRNFGAEVTDDAHPWYGAENIVPEEYGRALIALFISHILNPPPDSRWIGFKEIRYGRLGDDLAPMLNFMRANFPNAHFLFNTRAADDVVKSGWWQGEDEDEVRAMIADSDRRFADYAAAHPNCCHLTRYEDFSTDPGALQPFFDLLGEELDRDRVRALLDRRLDH